MKYSNEEIIQYVNEEDVKFIRLAFCDIYGHQKNISIMPSELPRAFEQGIPFDASAITGFECAKQGELFLVPEPGTLIPLPWRPEHGRVVQMFSKIKYSDGRPFECDTREVLSRAVEYAKEKGYEFNIGTKQEFYLFRLDDEGRPTDIPCDCAGFMDIAPEDKGENVRREICLTLEEMGISPESSHHEEGPGQNEIDFRYSRPLVAADNAETFQRVVKTIANRNGFFADFSPKPIADKAGNGFHINISVTTDKNDDPFKAMIAGILKNIKDITVFLNPVEGSYKRHGHHKAPKAIVCVDGKYTELLRVPAFAADTHRVELRSADPMANPYLAFALIIYAALDGITNNLTPSDNYGSLPDTLEEAKSIATKSEFLKEHLPSEILSFYTKS